MEGLLVKVTPFFLMLVLTTYAETYYVTPSASTPCPYSEEDVPCFTLFQYATKPRNYFASSTTFILLPGNHSLDVELFISSTDFLSVESNTTSHSDISITCHQSARLTFDTINVVSMRGLVLFGCVNNEVTRVEQFTLEDCIFQGHGRNGTSLELNDVNTANIMRSSFSSHSSEMEGRHPVGGAFIIISSLGITISHCMLKDNTVTGDGGAVYAESSPITIVNSTLNNNTVTGDGGQGGAVYAESSPITIVNSTLNYNTVTGDGGQGGAVYAKSSPITIVNSTLNYNTITGDGTQGGAVYAESSPITIVSSAFNYNAMTGMFGSGGAVDTYFSNITIVNSTLNNNAMTVTRGFGVGGAVSAYSSAITIVNSTLNNNAMIGAGGAVSSSTSIISRVPTPPIIIVNSTLNNNTVDGVGQGGAVYVISSYFAEVYSVMTIINSTLNNNSLKIFGWGGAVYVLNTIVTIVNSTLKNNGVVDGDGGAVCGLSSNIIIVNSTLKNNNAAGLYGGGGAVSLSYSAHLYIDNCTLNYNTATKFGGAVYSPANEHNNFISMHNSVFRGNTVTYKDGEGAAIYLISSTLNSSGFLDVQNNTATIGVMYAIQSTLYLSGNTTVSSNNGSLFFYSCNATFMGYTNVVNNLYSSNTSQEGGAVTTFQSDVVFMGRTNLMNNRAIQGGAIAAGQSKLYMYGDITVSHNTASVSGGGIYAYQSELNIKENINISKNSANDRGGGIYAISSTTRLNSGSKTYIDNNHAERGGGIYLESGAKIYLVKSDLECIVYIHTCNADVDMITFQLNNNTADYGGAVFVDDGTNFGNCYAIPFSDRNTISNECFIQGLYLYSVDVSHIDIKKIRSNMNILNTYFSDNSATVAGDVLYGGLLDRCRVSPYAELFQKRANFTPSSLSAVSYTVNITNLQIEDFNSTKVISSDPVRVCFCQDNQPDCSYHPQPKSVRKGETFTISLAAVDHINNTIANSTIHASVSLDAKLGEGQSSLQTSGDGECTDLTYSILSPYNSEKLHLYADGPCMSTGISTANLNVNIEPCPIGFIDNNLRCKCDPVLSSEYISNCFIDSETVQRKDNVWFAYVNTTEHQGFVLHQHCPFDYCRPPTENISVNLNVESGANELCMFNRSGKLCGSCEDGLSLSLGTSRCMPCSNNWLALLIVFAIAGVVLVAFLLKFNFTVAVGTFDGLIFYANVFAPNRAIFFPNDDTKILTVFIAWLNLDFGFETCFYDGMDGYAKIWLQLAFPLYVISLVAAIIVISDYSPRFAKLFTGKKFKNPIATLATLILLSYTKLLRTIIASLSFTSLQYSDGSHELVWLIDANIPYLRGKHIPLFITALAIVVVGTLYTIVLFAWQWLVYCPNKGPLRWIIGNTKVISLMDAYHNPYNKDHRYWIGLLLLVRVFLYLISSLNVLGDPHINLLVIALVLMLMFVFQRAIESTSKIHKKKWKELVETAFLLNLACLTTISFVTATEDTQKQNVVAYISTSIAFGLFLILLVYHLDIYALDKLSQKIVAKINLRLRKSQDESLSMNTVSATAPVEESVCETVINAVPHPELTDTIEELEESLPIVESNDVETSRIHSVVQSSHHLGSLCTHTGAAQILSDSIPYAQTCVEMPNLDSTKSEQVDTDLD